jgi:hypothetical protein
MIDDRVITEATMRLWWIPIFGRRRTEPVLVISCFVMFGGTTMILDFSLWGLDEKVARCGIRKRSWNLASVLQFDDSAVLGGLNDA